MTHEVLRNLCLDLSHIPEDEEEILEGYLLINKYNAAGILAKAIKALRIANEIITKQSDTILESTKEVTLCLKQFRIKNESNMHEVLPPTASKCSAHDIEVLSTENDNLCQDEKIINDPKVLTPECSVVSEKPIETLCAKTDLKCIQSYASAADSAKKKLSDDAPIGNDIADTGFQLVDLRRRKRKKRPDVVIGRKLESRLGTCDRANKCSVFVSRLSPNAKISDINDFCKTMLGEDCSVEKLPTRYQTYSSFKITCSRMMKNKIFNPDNWEAGIIIRPFYDHPSKL